MLNKLLHRKKKDKKQKSDKKAAAGAKLTKSASQTSVYNKRKSNNNNKNNKQTNDVSIIHTESMLDEVDDDIMPSNPTKLNNSSQSQDDLNADDLQKKQRKFQKKNSQKRHSHIGATRNHSSSLQNGKKQKKGSLHVPGKGNNHNNNNNKKSYSSSSTKNSSSTAMNSMMSSSATNKRLEQLMAMRAGKDAKGNRSRSVNVSKQKEKEKKYPKKRRSEVHKEPRRHSMFQDKVCLLVFCTYSLRKIAQNNTNKQKQKGKE